MNGRKCAQALLMALNSRRLICHTASMGDHLPWTLWLFRWASQLIREASVISAGGWGRGWIPAQTLDGSFKHSRECLTWRVSTMACLACPCLACKQIWAMSVDTSCVIRREMSQMCMLPCAREAKGNFWLMFVGCPELSLWFWSGCWICTSGGTLLLALHHVQLKTLYWS